MFRVSTQLAPAPHAPRHRGFTLIEAAIVTAIVGFCIVGVLQLMAAGTMANTQAAETTTAMGLANNIHERALSVKYVDIFTTFNDKTFSPPIDGKGNALSGMTGWQQIVDIKYVDPNAVTVDVPDSQIEPLARISVSIVRSGRAVFTTSWFAASSEWPLP
jgi:prepilin-type N-terminal cleavage/methylation domain-containing protein